MSSASSRRSFTCVHVCMLADNKGRVLPDTLVQYLYFLLPRGTWQLLVPCTKMSCIDRLRNLLTLVYSMFFKTLPGIRILLAYIRRAAINVYWLNISNKQADNEINKLASTVLE